MVLTFIVTEYAYNVTRENWFKSKVHFHVILTVISTHVNFLLLVKVGLLLMCAPCYTVMSEMAALFCQFHNMGV
jgi:hypothetical protein